jgi:hypothetical protein
VLFGEDPFYSRKRSLAGLPGKRRGLVVWMNMICDLMSHCFWVLFWHVNNSPLDALASLEKAVSPMCWKHKNKSISLWLGSWFTFPHIYFPSPFHITISFISSRI